MLALMGLFQTWVQMVRSECGSVQLLCLWGAGNTRTGHHTSRESSRVFVRHRKGVKVICRLNNTYLITKFINSLLTDSFNSRWRRKLPKLGRISLWALLHSFNSILVSAESDSKRVTEWPSGSRIFGPLQNLCFVLPRFREHIESF